MSESNNITWHDSEVTKEERQNRNGHKVQLFGLRGYLVQVNRPFLSL